LDDPLSELLSYQLPCEMIEGVFIFLNIELPTDVGDTVAGPRIRQLECSLDRARSVAARDARRVHLRDQLHGTYRRLEPAPRHRPAARHVQPCQLLVALASRFASRPCRGVLLLNCSP
jgi:hypothetical protein